MKKNIFTGNYLNKTLMLSIMTVLFIGLSNFSVSAQRTHIVTDKNGLDKPYNSIGGGKLPGINICPNSIYDVTIMNNSTGQYSMLSTSISVTKFEAGQSSLVASQLIGNLSSGGTASIHIDMANVPLAFSGLGYFEIQISFTDPLRNIQKILIYKVEFQSDNCN